MHHLSITNPIPLHVLQQSHFRPCRWFHFWPRLYLSSYSLSSTTFPFLLLQTVLLFMLHFILLNVLMFSPRWSKMFYALLQSEGFRHLGKIHCQRLCECLLSSLTMSCDLVVMGHPSQSSVPVTAKGTQRLRLFVITPPGNCSRCSRRYSVGANSSPKRS